MVGLVPKTNEPLPVSSVTDAIRFADVGVASQVATLVPKPDKLDEAIFVIVLDAPEIVLLVRVCDPVSVATVESIAIVTDPEPLYEVPERPVPIVSALKLDPNETPEIVELESLEFAIDPASIAFVTVPESVV